MDSQTKHTLDELTDDLDKLVSDESLDDEQLRDASEGLLPALCDALHAEGYGIRYFKIWSHEHQGWWKPKKQGYTKIRSEAGVYPFYEALEIVESANIGLKDIPNEAMVELAEEERYAV